MTARLLLAAAFLTACGETYPEPKQANVQATASVKTAERIGAEQQPRAATYLGYARAQLKQAQRLIADDDNERAAYVLSRARADADLAITITQAEAERTEATRIQDEVRNLQRLMPGQEK